MDPTVQLLLLLGTLSSALTKYVFVKEIKKWPDARSHCVKEQTDLASINDESDINLLRGVSRNYSGYIWFGLMRNMSDPDKWMWSGGGEVKWFVWDQGQPDSSEQHYGLLINYRWHDANANMALPFFCYSVHVVREKKTWEEALEHCRKHYEDLATISSETEMMMIQKELNKDVSTDHVWIGLHFLAGDWLWLDGHVREYEAWGSGGMSQCPEQKLACGALVVSGAVKEWIAHDCEEKLHFICF